MTTTSLKTKFSTVLAAGLALCAAPAAKAEPADAATPSSISPFHFRENDTLYFLGDHSLTKIYDDSAKHTKCRVMLDFDEQKIEYQCPDLITANFKAFIKEDGVFKTTPVKTGADILRAHLFFRDKTIDKAMEIAAEKGSEAAAPLLARAKRCVERRFF